MSKFLNPFVDYGFKYIFGREESKEFLIDFLNSLLEHEENYSPIVDLTYRDKEMSRRNEEDRGVIYDIHCRTADGRMFTVEMQNASQSYFLERILYYASRGVTEQGQTGKDWRYRYDPVYCVALMNFELPRFPGRFRIDGCFCDMETREVISDKIRCIFLQLPNFEKKDKSREQECRTALEQWMYNIINMSTMEGLAFSRERQLFARLEGVASYAALGESERRAYDADLKAYRDMMGQLEYARESSLRRGREEGREEEKIKIVKSMADNGLSISLISEIVGLPQSRIKEIVG